MNDTATQMIISDLIASGRLVINGKLTLDGQVMADNSSEPNNEPDRYGWLKPETAFGGRQNVKVNELIDDWANSSDRIKQKVAAIAPRLFVVIDEHYNPKQGSPEWLRIWRNNSKYFFFAQGRNKVHPFFENATEKIENHWFYAGQNYTWFDAPNRGAEFLNKILPAVEFWMNEKYDLFKHGDLGLG